MSRINYDRELSPYYEFLSKSTNRYEANDHLYSRDSENSSARELIKSSLDLIDGYPILRCSEVDFKLVFKLNQLGFEVTHVVKDNGEILLEKLYYPLELIKIDTSGLIGLVIEDLLNK